MRRVLFLSYIELSNSRINFKVKSFIEAEGIYPADITKKSRRFKMTCSGLKTFLSVLTISIIIFFSSTTYASKDKVAVLIDSSLYTEVSVKFDRYIQEVQERFPVSFIIFNTQNWNSQTPVTIRNFLIQKYQEEGIKGALLVGQIPYAIWKQTYGTNEGISSVFYEDMDGSFQDTNSDGKYDYHTFGENEGTEIWVCWMRPPSSNPSFYLNRLFDKAHDYYTGAFVTNKMAFVAAHQDYDGNIYNSTLATAPRLEAIYGVGNVITDGVGADLTYATDVMNQLTTVGFEIYDTWQHASSTYQQWDSGGHFSSQIMTMDNATHTAGSLITFIYGCHSADFHLAPGSTSSNVTCAAAYPFGTSIGQAGTGTSWSYGTEYKYMVMEAMRIDDCYLGEGWGRMENFVESASFVRNRYPDRDPSKECAGNNLIGNPFLIIKYSATADSDDDGIPDWWEYRHSKPTYSGCIGLKRWVADSSSDNDGDGYTNLEEYLRGTDPTKPDNTKPYTPVLVSPPDGAYGLSMTPTLVASGFSDPDGDSHFASHWQVDDDANFLSPVWDTGDNYPATTQVTVPEGILTEGTYYWRVRYKDERLWSNWSLPRCFDTHIGVTFYVSDISDPLEDGTLEHPFDTIQEAIDIAFNGDMVVVLDGIYRGEGNREIDFLGKSILVKSKNGALRTIIDCEGAGRGFFFHLGETSNSVLDGFTITNGFSPIDAGAIYCENSSPIIKNCIMTGNTSTVGGAIASYVCDNLQIINCLIADNNSSFIGGGLAFGEATVTITSCTISNNEIDSVEGFGGGIYSSESNVNLINCIVWDNYPQEIFIDGSIPVTADYSDIKGESVYPGTSNINSDPLFASNLSGTYYLSHADIQGVQSPCVNAGSDSSENTGLNKMTTRTDDGYDTGVVDMGFHYPVFIEVVITSMAISDENLTIQWNTRSGASYTVQWSTDMLNWNNIPVGETGTWTDTDIGGYQNKFYRIFEQ